MPLSERVVLVPSQRGAVTVQSAAANGPNMAAASGSEVATVYGHPPPPIAVAPVAPRTVALPSAGAPVLTPFGELSAFINKRPSMTVLAIGGGVAVLALFVMVATIAWFVSRPSAEKAEIADPAVVTIPTTTPTTTAATTPATMTARPSELPPPPPAPRRSRR
jgi:hypothetical protein